LKIKWLDRRTVIAPHLTLCLSEKEYLAVCKHLKVENPTPWVASGARATNHTFESDGRLTCVVCMSELAQESEGVEVAALIVHEATHIKQELMQSIGETHPSPEFEAYTMQSICQTLFEEYARRALKN
jgi:hypothetical protein